MKSFTSNNLPELLKSKGLKSTPGRLAILTVFFQNKKPLSIQTIHEKILNKKIDLATVYRTTEIFKTVGILKEINLEHGHTHFELNIKNHHHHVICEKCGNIQDLSTCNLDKSHSLVMKSSGFKHINRHSLEFFGLCSKCG